ncbi:MAG: CpsD/CapB family tyrosine-protein kinase [Lachnospiraceae bacterium]|nr:CpsD/CapB family tyrosine-protein kinase [Lachnospiraceae bacterium]
MENNKSVSLYENENQLIVAAIDKIVVEIFNKNQDGKDAQLILLTGCSALAGTTSTCIGLSIAVANTQRKTLLIDCDMRKTKKYKKLSEQATIGLADFLSQDHFQEDFRLDDIIYETNINNLSYIPCGANIDNPTRLLCSTKMHELIEFVKQNYDCVIFDVPSLTIVPDAQTLFQEVDGIILLSSLGETSKKQVKEAKFRIKSYKSKYYGMIVNKIPTDMYRTNVRDYDYYFVNQNGEQKLNRSPAHKKYMQRSERGTK